MEKIKVVFKYNDLCDDFWVNRDASDYVLRTKIGVEIYNYILDKLIDNIVIAIERDFNG